MGTSTGFSLAFPSTDVARPGVHRLPIRGWRWLLGLWEVAVALADLALGVSH